MQIIEAFLAFAVTMLILSMVASMCVEMFHRALRTRAEGFKRMLDQLYDDVLLPYAKTTIAQPGSDKIIELAADAAKRAGKTKTFTTVDEALKYIVVRSLSENRTIDRTLNTCVDVVTKIFRADVTKVTPAEFVERLAAGPLGKAIEDDVKNLAGTVQAKIDEERAKLTEALARRFESYGSEVSIWFQARARLTSVIAGLILAFVVHVDAIVLMRGFMADPALARAVAAQAEQVTARFAAQIRPQDANTPPAQAPDAAEARRQIEELRSLGTPIGWRDGANGTRLWFDRGAHCDELRKGGTPNPQLHPYGWLSSVVGDCGCSPYVWLPASVSVFVGLILGGLLIGLGAPFWYRAVQCLVHMRGAVGAAADMARGTIGGGSGPTRGTGTPPPPAPAFDLLSMANLLPNGRMTPPKP